MQNTTESNSEKRYWLNRRLIFKLSLFGVAMGFATVFWISSNAEPFFWLAIFIFCAVVIAKEVKSKFFLHGFLTSVLNSIWITIIHIALFDTYIANHPEEVEMMERMPLPYSLRIAMLLMGPIIGVMSGVVLGLFCIIASKTIKRKRNAG